MEMQFVPEQNVLAEYSQADMIIIRLSLVPRPFSVHSEFSAERSGN